MGKKPGDIEQEIAAKREAISRKIDEIAERGSEDAQELNERFQEIYNDLPLKDVAHDHPFLTVAGALGVGVVLGMASESVSLGGDGRSSSDDLYRERERSRDGGGGLVSGLVGAIEGMALDEGRRLLREWMAPAREDDGRYERQTQE